jgi:hypothetical protein
MRNYYFSPSYGYHVSDVVIDGVSIGAFSSYVFTSVKVNHTIYIVFASGSSSDGGCGGHDDGGDDGWDDGSHDGHSSDYGSDGGDDSEGGGEKSSTKGATNFTATTDPVKIFPNPTVGLINVVIPSEHTNPTIQIMDMSGREVVSRTITDNTGSPVQFDLSDVASGMYLINVTAGSKSIYQVRIVVR